MITCPALTLPDNVGIIVHPPSSNGNQILSSIGTGTQQTYYTGSEAIYSCVPGFNHSGGDLTRTCLSNGSWSGDPAMCNGKFFKDKNEKKQQQHPPPKKNPDSKTCQSIGYWILNKVQ